MELRVLFRRPHVCGVADSWGFFHAKSYGFILHESHKTTKRLCITHLIFCSSNEFMLSLSRGVLGYYYVLEAASESFSGFIN